MKLLDSVFPANIGISIYPITHMYLSLVAEDFQPCSLVKHWLYGKKTIFVTFDPPAFPVSCAISHLCQITNFNETCVLLKMGENCHTLIGYLAVYRVAFSMVVFHGVLMILTLGVSTSGSWRASLHNGWVAVSGTGTRWHWHRVALALASGGTATGWHWHRVAPTPGGIGTGWHWHRVA